MHGWRMIVASLLLVCPVAEAQTLGELARRIEDSRKHGAPAGIVYDERNLNPALARRDLLRVQLDPARWSRFLAADRHVGKVLAADPDVLHRLEGLNYTSLRSVGHFLQREPALAAVLRAAQLDPHEYAAAYLASKLALSTLPDAREPAAAANAAFLKARRHEVASLAIPLHSLSLHLLRAPAPRLTAASPPGAAAPHVTGAPAPPAGSAPRDDGGVIDMSEGAWIPDFDFVDFDGRRRRLSDFRGRYVMLDFWGSWCPPCRAEVPFVKDAYARFGSRGFEVLGMDSERGATMAEVQAYLDTNDVRWTFATPDSVRRIIDERFQIPAFPRVILLDPEGRVVESNNNALRGENLARTLDRLLPR